MNHTANPITTAIRSWVLRSPARLALGLLIAVVAVVAVRAVITAATGSTTGTSAETVAADTTPTTTPTAPPAASEVTESEVLGFASTSVTDTPARAAMFYAHVFLDTTASATQWTVRLATVTDADNITDRIAAARPAAPVTILGATRTTTSAGAAGTRVEIDTSSGTLSTTLTDTGDRWQLSSPLPTLDLTALPTAPTTRPAPTTTRTPATTTSAPTTTPASPSAPAPAAPPVRLPVPTIAPAPVPGPIPIPDLDTPLPGARQ